MAVLTSEQMPSTEKKISFQDVIGKPPPKYREIDSVEAVKLLNGAYGEKDLSKSSCSSSRSSLSQPPEYSIDIPDDQKPDPWKECNLQKETKTKIWKDLSVKQKLLHVTGWILKPVLLLGLLYVFVCSLNLMSSAFRLIGGKLAGKSFSSGGLVQNPVCGLMIGIVSTVLVQSSSTSTSIVVTMVASGILDVKAGIPIIMGANIGTSVTNTVVSMMQSTDRAEFRRAFGGATVHDMFNWLSVLIFLPLEVITGYLYHLTSVIVASLNLNGESRESQDFLKTITKPLLNKIIRLDKDVILKIALGEAGSSSQSMIKRWCKFDIVEVNSTKLVNKTFVQQKAEEIIGGIVTFNENVTQLQNETYLTTETINKAKCDFLFARVDMDDTTIGLILLVISLFFLCICLILMVKLLSSLLRGSICRTLKKLLNTDSKNCLLRHLMGYFAILLGAGMTILVQSSSVFTSVLTPMVGIGVIEIERMYPLTLGSNIGTTTTCVLAALAASSDKLGVALQIALCHFFFNISGIILFYPIPQMRIPIKLAKIMGNTTAKYRWFALMYLICMFILLPGTVFALSLCGTIVMFSVLGPVMLIAIAVIIINLLQRKKPTFLPKLLQNWNFLPKFLHSLDPLDQLIVKVISLFKKCLPCSLKKKPDTPVSNELESEMQPISHNMPNTIV